MCIPGVAQITTGDIVGTVQDNTGALVPAAKVTAVLLSTQTIRTVTTGASGDFTLSFLQPGHYSITVEAAGFQKYQVNDLLLSTGDRTRVDASLAVGQAEQTVEVSASNTATLQSDSSTRQEQIGSQEVQDLPLNGRNLVDLVQTAPGAVTPAADYIGGGTHPDDRRQSSTILVNGQNDKANQYLVDGLDNIERQQGVVGVRPSIDAIAQMNIITSNYPAEVSRAGGAVVNVITKAGTNQFHGSAFEFLRNDATDARDYFSTTGPKSELRRNQFGGSLGGPIRKDKTFFFAAYEQYREVAGTLYTTTVPTLYEQQNPGDFTDIGGPSLPAMGIPLSPASANYFKLYPAPNQPATISGGIPTLNYSVAPRRTQYSTTFDARVDHHFSDRNTLFGHFSYNPVTTFVPAAFPATQVDGKTVYPGGAASSLGGIFGNIVGPSKTTSQLYALDYVHVFTPQLVGELRGGYTRINIQSKPLNYGTSVSNSLGVVNGNIGPDSSALTIMNFFAGPYAQLGDGAYVPIKDVNNIYQINGSVIYSRGQHSVKIGGAVIYRQLNYFQDPFPQGGFTFASFCSDPALLNSSNPMVNFLQGCPFFGFRGNLLVSSPGFRDWEPSGFVQDDWRVTPKLTLNLGLRYEVTTPITEAHNNYSNFSLANTEACQSAGTACANSIVLAGKTTSSSLGVNTDHSNVSPRVGFAFTPHPNTVVRAGFGRSFFPAQYGSQIQNANPPFTYMCFPCFGLTYPVLPLPSASSITDPAGSLAYAPPNLKLSTNDEWNLTVEQQFGKHTFTMAYVGERGVNVYYLNDLDRPHYPGAGNPQPAYVYATALPNVSSIAETSGLGSFNYQGLQLSYELQPLHGLSMRSNYTWAHALGVSTASQPAAGTLNLIPGDVQYDYGRSGSDVRNRFLTTLTYELPFGKSMSGVEKEVVAGWQLNSIAYWQTGIPFTVINGDPQINVPNVGSDRPNLVGSPFHSGAVAANPGCTAPSAVHTVTSWFNPCAFAPQTFGTPGNEGVNAFTGPSQRSLALSIFKNFELTEAVKLQFRAEGYNVTNTPNFRLPSNDISGTAGVINQTNSPSITPRQYQFALKLLF